MKYRKFGNLDWQASVLGFGCMRLPLTNREDPTSIDEEQATEMLHYAIGQGVNYLDSAYGYHRGQSERFLGKALAGGWRERVHLATKSPIWLLENESDFEKKLDEQLGKLQTSTIDHYLLHGLGADSWEKVQRLNVLTYAQKAFADGRVRSLGFSFHDNYQVFKKIVDAFDWAFCQIQYNYMDVANQAGRRGLQYAAAKGLAVVVMEPLLGGKLVKAPEPIQAVWATARVQRSPADWALQWLWNQPEVTVVLSGMSHIQQVQENIASAGRAEAGSLSSAEKNLVTRVRAVYKTLSPIPCTQCEYCLPCPNGVNIPRNFGIYNDGAMYGTVNEARGAYQRWLDPNERASECENCDECEPKCPQHILISDWLPKVHAVLGEGQAY